MSLIIEIPKVFICLDPITLYLISNLGLTKKFTSKTFSEGLNHRKLRR